MVRERMLDLGVQLPDSAAFTPEGRRLLVSLGVVERDPLRVAAERWLQERPPGPTTEAVAAVRAALGPPWPAEWLEAAERMRATPWKGPLA